MATNGQVATNAAGVITSIPLVSAQCPELQADFDAVKAAGLKYLDSSSFAVGWLMRESLARRQIAALVPDRGTGLQPVSVGGTDLQPVSDRGTGLQPVMGVCDCGKIEHGRHHMRCPALRPADTTCSVCKSNIAVCECGG